MTTTKSQEIEVAPPAGMMTREEMTVQDLVAQVRLIADAMRAVMREDEHYGVIPGTQKPTLYKPGAEKLCILFRLGPEYEVIREHYSDKFISVTVRATLFHIPTGNKVASGIGSCNTREKKYRYTTKRRPDDQKPDKAEADQLKAEDKGYWRKFDSKWVWFDKVENDNPYEYENTVVKMASKRALVAAVLNATAASDIFTQDVEDMPGAPNGDAVAAFPPAHPEDVKLLREMLVEVRKIDTADEFWAEEVLLANCTRRFGRPIEKLEDLRKPEVDQLLAGIDVWAKAAAEQAVIDVEEESNGQDDSGKSGSTGRKKKEAADAS